jgi:L-malate glycosyltransferase
MSMVAGRGQRLNGAAQHVSGRQRCARSGSSSGVMMHRPFDRLTASPDAAVSAMPAVRVVHVVYELRHGGMELGVLKLTNALDATRIQSAICSTRPAPALRHLAGPGVRLFELDRRPKGNDPRVAWSLYALFRRERPHIVHTHAWGTLLEGVIAARLARVPIVVHGEHGTLQVSMRQRWPQRLAWSCVDQVLSVSSRLGERMAREVGFPVGRIRTIRNGVDVARFRRVEKAEARAALGVPAEGFVAVTVGRLVRVKDHARLLDAVARLRQDGLPVTLLIAGDGPLKSDLEQQSERLGMQKHVHMLGHRQDVEIVLAAGDVFVLPSRSEGLSNTILESMAAGLPVVATRVGGADEMVIDGRTGILVRPECIDDLVTALRAVMSNPSMCYAMGQAGRERVEAEFDIAKMAREYESLYLELASSRIAASR